MRTALFLAAAFGLLCLVSGRIMAAEPAKAGPPRVDRLDRLADHLDRIEPAGFDMNSWGSCAAYRATEVFSDAGFLMGGVAPLFEGAAGFDACRKFFRIDDLQVYHLFGNQPSPVAKDPRAAARRIREVAAMERARLAALEREDRPPCELASW